MIAPVITELQPARMSVAGSDPGIHRKPEEVFYAILVAAVPQTRESNRILNKLALVCGSWHTMLAPPTEGSIYYSLPFRLYTRYGGLFSTAIPTLTRRVTLADQALRAVTHIKQPWWRSLRAHRDATDIGVGKLAAECQSFTDLDLSWCEELTDIALRRLAGGVASITHLDLSQCIQITDTGIASLASGCPAITDLKLCGCIMLTDAGLASLAAGCTVIKHLDLTECVQITDAGVASLAEGLGSVALNTINLSDCIWITDAGLASLGARCTNISCVDLSRNSQVTLAGLATLPSSSVATKRCEIERRQAGKEARMQNHAATRIQAHQRGKRARFTAEMKRVSAAEAAIDAHLATLRSMRTTLAAKTPYERTVLLASMTPKARFAALAVLPPDDQAATLAAMPAEEQADFLAAMSAEDRVAGWFRGQVNFSGIGRNWAVKLILYMFLKSGSGGLCASCLAAWAFNRATELAADGLSAGKPSADHSSADEHSSDDSSLEDDSSDEVPDESAGRNT